MVAQSGHIRCKAQGSLAGSDPAVHWTTQRVALQLSSLEIYASLRTILFPYPSGLIHQWTTTIRAQEDVQASGSVTTTWCERLGMEIRLAAPGDIAGMLQLQAEYFIENLAAEARQGSFVSAEFTSQQLEDIAVVRLPAHTLTRQVCFGADGEDGVVGRRHINDEHKEARESRMSTWDFSDGPSRKILYDDGVVNEHRTSDTSIHTHLKLLLA